MTEEDRSKAIREKSKRFADLARAKGYTRDDILSAGIIAGSQQMYDNFGDFLQALDKCYELCERCDDPGQMLEGLLKLTGYDSDSNGDEEDED